MPLRPDCLDINLMPEGSALEDERHPARRTGRRAHPRGVPVEAAGRRARDAVGTHDPEEAPSGTMANFGYPHNNGRFATDTRRARVLGEPADGPLLTLDPMGFSAAAASSIPVTAQWAVTGTFGETGRRRGKPLALRPRTRPRDPRPRPCRLCSLRLDQRLL